MDKLIEMLVEKKMLLVATIMFVGFNFLPSLFLVFIWNRTLFCEIDFLKLVLLSASIGSIFLFINFFIVSVIDELYVAFSGKKEGLSGVTEDSGVKMFFYYGLAIMFSIVEQLLLSGAKSLFPTISLGQLIDEGFLIYGAILILYAIIKIISYGVIAYRKCKGSK